MQNVKTKTKSQDLRSRDVACQEDKRGRRKGFLMWFRANVMKRHYVVDIFGDPVDKINEKLQREKQKTNDRFLTWTTGDLQVTLL